jgi:hypothetical protein
MADGFDNACADLTDATADKIGHRALTVIPAFFGVNILITRCDEESGAMNISIVATETHLNSRSVHKTLRQRRRPFISQPGRD